MPSQPQRRVVTRVCIRIVAQQVKSIQCWATADDTEGLGHARSAEDAAKNSGRDRRLHRAGDVGPRSHKALERLGLGFAEVSSLFGLLGGLWGFHQGLPNLVRCEIVLQSLVLRGLDRMKRDGEGIRPQPRPRGLPGERWVPHAG